MVHDIVITVPAITPQYRNAYTMPLRGVWFAMDFWKLDTLGSPARGTGDTKVVATENGAAQDYATRRQRPGESDDAYRQRITQYNANGEYSAYGHLKSGSVTVTPGASVVPGQQIGEVGDTRERDAHPGALAMLPQETAQ